MSHRAPSSNPPMAGLDWEVLEPILALHRTREERADFLQTCSRSLAELMVRLRDAATTGAGNDVARCAHALKGAAATIGAFRLADAASRLESSLRTASDADRAADLLSQTTGAWDSTLRELTEARRSQGGGGD